MTSRSGPVVRCVAVSVLAAIVVTSGITMGSRSADAVPVLSELNVERSAAKIAELLQQRSETVLNADVDAHMATLAPSAGPSVWATESRLVFGAETIGLVTYVEALAEPVVDLSPPGANVIDGNRAITLEVKRTMRIGDFDERDHISSLFMTFVHVDGAWKLHGDHALSSIGLAGDRELWELYDTEIVRRETVVVVGTASRARLTALADLTEDAIDRFERSWPWPWAGRVVVMVPARSEELERLLQPTIDVSKFVAFTTLSVDRSEGWFVVAPRIVAQEGNLALRSPARQIDILVHELTHMASVTVSGPATPLWAHEGLAEWVTAGRPSSNKGALELPDLHLFRTGSSAEIRQVYDQAADTMQRIAGSFGDEAPWELFQHIGAAVRVAGTNDHILDRALRAVTGFTLEELTR